MLGGESLGKTELTPSLYLVALVANLHTHHHHPDHYPD